jgi:hypothetical protein
MKWLILFQRAVGDSGGSFFSAGWLAHFTERSLNRIVQ